MNRTQRRAAARSARPGDDVVIAPDRALLIQVLAALVEADPTVSGATLIMPDGAVSYVDAAMLRQGGPHGPHRLLAPRAAGSLRGEDFHETPRIATEALLRVETFTGAIWEPARGRGAVLEEYGHTVISTDLVDRGFGTGRVDFLLEQHGLAPNIITNPPYDRLTHSADALCAVVTL